MMYSPPSEDPLVVRLVVQLVCCWAGGERNNQPLTGAAKVAMGYDDDDDGKGMATALRATKLTLMATMTTMATGDNNDDGDGATGDGATIAANDDDKEECRTRGGGGAGVRIRSVGPAGW